MQTGSTADTAAGEIRVADTPETARKALLIGVPKETAADEKRVATVPDVVEKLIKLGFSVAVQVARATRPTSTTTHTAPPVRRFCRRPQTSGPRAISFSRCAPRPRTRWP